jgi:hypothetical protein
LRLNFQQPVPAVFANNLQLTFDGSSVYLAFFQVTPPFVSGATEEEQRKPMDQIASVKAQPVVRLVMPLQLFREVARAVQEQLTRIESVLSK